MNQYEEFGVKDKIQVLAMSAGAAEKLQPASVNLVLTDPAGDYDSVKSDLLNWYPKHKGADIGWGTTIDLNGQE
jgi:hypothetical protein